MQMTVQNKWKGRKNKPKQKHLQTSRELLRIQSDLAKKKYIYIMWCQILRYRYKMEREKEVLGIVQCVGSSQMLQLHAQRIKIPLPGLTLKVRIKL